MKTFLIGLTSCVLATAAANAQYIDEPDESKLYAQTKQVNQFFRRFNGEEDEKGDRFYSENKQYRNPKLRKKYLEILFDASNAGMTQELKSEFIKVVLDKSNPGILDFHQPNWFCEVKSTFSFKGKPIPVTLFMELEKAQLGRKWVITRVYTDAFNADFKRDTARVGKFLHPMSHELDFMNLRKAFLTTDSVSQFATRTFTPDHLTLFLYEARRGTLKFETVNDLKFHIFQIDGWYFELAEFNRTGYNTGWLISNLVKLNGASDKEVLRKYLLK